MSRRGENIYKRKDGRWEARIVKPDGKYRYIYAKTYSDVKEKKLKLQECVLRPFDTKKISITQHASELFECWLKNSVRDQVKPSTYENYYYCMQKYVIPFFIKKENEQITEYSVARFVASIKFDHSISDSYKRKILTIFKTALKEILKGAEGHASITEAVKLPRVESTAVQVFSVKEQRLIERIIIHSEDRRTLGILLCFYTGIRLGELCGLKWSDIDFEAGTMSVARTVSRTKNFQREETKTMLLVGTPKSHKSVRKIPLPDFLIQLFMEFKSFSANENGYVLSRNNIPIDPRTCQKLYKKILEEAGVKDRKFHAIRHTFATRALELGVDIKTLSEILGHSNVSVTLNIYAHSLMEQKKIAMDKLNELHMTHMKAESFAVTSSVTAYKETQCM
ncbi:site-specific integrase [Clostridium aminobutyricum]|uniref:Tyrosine-type recombinase/integrase n=1 Tax=Clostridium aminobutyricum TaxID=33953 RepID=A0A939DB74_CLOAM|nr:site-specific integrase [Clostridium aminobutyricum]MBN7774632.1 tyrosine-type recombinase/integrase [Clostridium aminobutyricum]